MSDEERNLSDGDVRAVSRQLVDDLKSEFYSELGKGVWGVFWKTLLLAAMICVVVWQGYRNSS